MRRWLLLVVGAIVIFFGFSRINQPARSHALPIRDTLQVRGRDILDTCGNRLVLRGPEQGSGWTLPLLDGGDSTSLDMPRMFAAAGANAMRAFFSICPETYATYCQNLNGVEQFIQASTDAGLVTFVMAFWDTYLPDGGLCTADGGQGDCPAGQTCCNGELGCGERLCRHPYPEWFAQAETKAMFDRYKKWLIIDSSNELNVECPDGGDRECARQAWRDIAIENVLAFRDAGYTEPLSAITLQAGRDLPAILRYGQSVEDADPLHKTILGWQAYWGVWSASGYRQDGTCIPWDGYPCCEENCPPTEGFYQHDANGGYGGEVGLANPTSIVNGIDVAANALFPIYVGFNYDADPDSITDWKRMFDAAARNNTSWLWWMFVLPTELPKTHDTVVDATEWARCTATVGEFAHVCDTHRAHLEGQDWIPAYPYGPTVIASMDAGTNRACGQ